MEKDNMTRPNLIPSGDVEQDITQLVCLIESIQPDDADQASTPGLTEVVEFARALRASWDEDPDAYLDHDPGPEVDDEGGMSEYRYATPEDLG